ncbi:VOC family protein [Arthrobacter sp. NPDC058097]|uniref:VOC family protein n=1 Tax=Arthrobacter sp. NPDC058097 TaxID=3346340 RepID=UPI0036DD9A4E
MNIDHIGLSVENIDAQIRWYGQALGMKVVKEFTVQEPPIKGVFLTGNGLVLELLERAGSLPRPATTTPMDALLTRGYGHICLRVTDLGAIHHSLLKAGACEIMAPQGAPEAGIRMSFIADPEGNLIELIDDESLVDT